MQKIGVAIMSVAGLIFAGCPDNQYSEPPPAAPGAEPAFSPDDSGPSLAEIEEEVRSIEGETRASLLPENQEVDLPDGVPVPDQYAVISDTRVGPMSITTIEVSEDLAALVDEFNARLDASGHEVEPLFREAVENGAYQARGRMSFDQTRVTITVADADARATVLPESSGTVTYQVTALE